MNAKKIVIRNRVGELMAAWSTKHGRRLTQTELSDETGVAQSTISALVRNDVSLYHVATLEKLLAFFECRVADFFAEVEVESEEALGEVLAYATSMA